MCWFVTIGVTAVGAVALEELDRAHGGLDISKSSNPHMARIFDADDILFEITYGGCSCDLYTYPRESAPVEHERARARYRRKGWSEAKIARALEATETAKSAGVDRNSEIGPERAFRDAISNQVREFGSVRIFAHMYNASQDEEQVTCLGRRRITLDAFLESGFPPDELVEIADEAG